MRHCFTAILFFVVAFVSACGAATVVHEDAGFACGDILSDARNCGACGHVCMASDNGMPVCSAGTCAVTYTLATGQTKPQDIVVSGDTVFWVNQGSEDVNEDYNDDGALVSVPTAGGTTHTLASGQLNPTGLALDSSNLYFSNLGYRYSGGTYQDQTGSIMLAPLPSGTSSVALYPHLTEVGAIAIAGSDVLWISTKDFQVYSAPLAGGTPSTFATGPAGGYVALATDANNAYVASGEALVKIPLSGGSPVTLSTDISDPRAIAVDTNNVYWTNYDEGGDGEVLQVSISGGKTITLANELQGPVDIVSDGQQVYWVDQWSGDIQRVAVGGGNPATLVSIQNEPVALALDATSVYWVDRETGNVMKVTPR